MNCDQVFSWILSHPQSYPGLHLKSQPRTEPSQKPLEAKAQFHLVLKSLSEYIRENLEAGRGVNLQNFGGFTFEINSDIVKPAQQTQFQINQPLEEQRLERKHVHKIRPCFVVDPKLQYCLKRHPGKEELTTTKSQHSIYQKGFGMIYCNPVPLAQACYLGKDVVKSIIESFCKACHDLVNLNYDVVVDLGFVRINFLGKQLKYEYKQSFVSQLNSNKYESKLRKSDMTTSNFWTTGYQEKWATSTLNSIIRKPNPIVAQKNYEKTLALKIMSLDLNTSDRTFLSVGRKNILPKIDRN